jgi:hypothetical protein
VAGSCERADEPSVSTKCGQFLDQQRNYQLLKKNSDQLGQLVNKQMSINIIKLPVTNLNQPKVMSKV